MFPSKEQWVRWSLPSKLTAIGAYVGILAFVLTVLSLLIDQRSIEKLRPQQLNDTQSIVSISQQQVLPKVLSDQEIRLRIDKYIYDKNIKDAIALLSHFKGNSSKMEECYRLFRKTLHVKNFDDAEVVVLECWHDRAQRERLSEIEHERFKLTN